MLGLVEKFVLAMDNAVQELRDLASPACKFEAEQDELFEPVLIKQTATDLVGGR